MSTRLMLTVALVLVLGTALYSLALYPSLPQLIPTHWNINGQPDQFSDKHSAMFLMPVIMLALLVMMVVLPWLSPQKFRVEGFRPVWNVVTVLVLVMLAFIHLMMLQTALHPGVMMNRAIIAGLCLFLAAVGLYMPRVHRNFWMGIRTPWTLASEEVWTETHRLAVWTMGIGGLLGAVLTVVGAAAVGFILMISGAILPALYSLWLYKKLEREGKLQDK